MKKKTMWILIGSVAGMTAVGATAVAVWNSKQMKMLRVTRRAGKALYKVGSVLQTVSGVVE